MLVKMKGEEQMWVVCKKCGAAIKTGSSGGCKCGNIKTERTPLGATMVVADDTDEVVYDNE